MDRLTKQDIEKEDINFILKNTKKELTILSGKTILFTGAFGFLGYYFLKSLLEWNDLNEQSSSSNKKKIKVIALDNVKGKTPKWLYNADVTILKKDITKYKIPKNLQVDYIVHAATIASPIFYRENPIETINANILGLYNILNYLVKQKTRRPVLGLLFFSTSEIYGDPTAGNIPTPEDYRGNVSCTGPRACYDESKRFGETLCVNFARVHNLPIKIARPFNNYGPGLKITDGRVIPDFSKDILAGNDISIFSQGSPSRTFCYITDAIVGYIKILIKGKSGESYNIGVEKPEIKISDLALKMQKIAKKYLGYNGKVSFKKSADKNYLTDNPNRRCPIIIKAKKDLGFNPSVSLEEGLTKTLLWYKNLE